MRGKEASSPTIGRFARITPAYAGKSCRKADHHPRWRDHPRICGEKSRFAPPPLSVTGSPPHMRGKDRQGAERTASAGITPAYAGKRWAAQSRAQRNWDHPRICGEKDALPDAEARIQGSPPHMRGKGKLSKRKDGLYRITPAYAGKRLKRSRSTVPPVAIVPLFPSVCNKPVVSDGSPAGRDAPLFLPAENAVPASPAYNLRSL